MPTTDLPDLADLAEGAALTAAAFLRAGLERGAIAVETKSTGTDMVSEMDRGAERLIVEALLGARPDDGLLGEEGAARPGTSGVRWVIDPLDGTTNYLYGHPSFSVSIAAEQDGRAVAGVVIDVPTGEVYRAVRGGGATRDGATISVSGETDLARALVATGFGYQPAQRRHQGAILASLLDQIRDIRRSGSAALDLCSMACGRVDAYYELSLSRWDFAAGALIATEAGALVMDLAGTYPDAAPLLAAPPALAEPLRALLLSAGAAP
ncbi:MAG TPA: inositol monophosphatase family protein [Acidimicrobiales bacterium]